MKKWVVYRHTSPSGKVYIGITSNIKHRWASNGKNYCTYDSIFKKAIEKYGWNNIQHEILLWNCSKSEAIYAEKYLIRWYKLHNISYNVTDGGDGMSGVKPSEKCIQRIVDTRISHKEFDYLVVDKDFNYMLFPTTVAVANYLEGERSNVSNVLRRPIGYTFKGHYILEHKKDTPIDMESIKACIQNALKQRHEKMSENNKNASQKALISRIKTVQEMSQSERRIKFGHGGMKGKHHSAETKMKMSKVARNRDMTKAIEATQEAHRKAAIPIIVTKDGNFVGEFQIVADVCRALDLNKSNAYRALRNGLKISGYSIMYKEGVYVN